MVAIFTGVGVGAEQGSMARLGASGLLGNGAFGRNGESLFLNAATGNLMIRQRDEFLAGLGPDAMVSRTYNSKGALDENGDNWRQSTDRRIRALTGTVNTSGSTITRVSADGSEIIFTYDGSQYVSDEGEGAEDTLSFDAVADEWTWNDGSSLNTEVYGVIANHSGEWYIKSVVDYVGNTVDFTYNSTTGKLEKLTTDSGEELRYVWSGNNITEIQTAYYEDPADTTPGLVTLKRVYYTYDNENRLSTVTIDMSPEDESTSDNEIFTTTYTYDGTSDRIETISQTGGAKVEFTYSNDRVTQIEQTIEVDGANIETRITSIEYLTNETRITAPDGARTDLKYDATTKNLTEILAPAASGTAARQKIEYSYYTTGASTGRLEGVIRGLEGVAHLPGHLNSDGFTTSYQYDAAGNVTQIRNALNEVTTRTYNAENLMLTQTVTGSTSAGLGQSLTHYYVYDSLDRLRFEVSAEGRVQEHRYYANGIYSSTIEYLGGRFDASSTAVTLSTVNTWRLNTQDMTEIVRKFEYHDARGQRRETRDYGSTNSSGNGQIGEGVRRIYYTYDQHGQLLETNEYGQQKELFTYDGMGRIVSSTDLNGETTTIVFNDGALTTTVTTGSGLTTTTTYNEGGEVVSESFSGTDVNGGTEQRYYDENGRVVWVNNVRGGDTSFFYDDTGRLLAKLDNRLSMERYQYDDENRIIGQINHYHRAEYATLDANALMLALAAEDHGFTLNELLPPDHWRDIESYTIYDALGRVAQTILGDGSVTSFTYDQAGRLITTINHINKVDASNYWNGVPTAPVSVTSHASDQVMRNFYDGDGMLIGVLDANGYLTETEYDDAGRAVRVTEYANKSTYTDLVSGSFDQVFGGVSADSVNDQTIRRVYDGQNLLRYFIDAEGRVTERVYFESSGNEAIGVERQVIQYAEKLAVNHSDWTFDGVRVAIGELSDPNSIASAGGRTQTNVYNDRRQVTYSIDALGHVMAFEYNAQGLVTKQTAFAATYSLVSGDIPTDAEMDTWAGNNAAGARVSRSFYNPAGQLVLSVDPLGLVVEYAYNQFGSVTDVTEYAATLTVDDNTTLASLQAANKGDSYSTQSIYNGDNQLYRHFDQFGVRTDYYHSFNGFVHNTITAFGTFGQEVRTPMQNDAAGRTYRVQGYRDVDNGGLFTITQTAYDGAGNVTSILDARGNTTTFTYDAMGRVKTETNAEGEVVTYTYDGFGRIDTVTDARNGVVDTDYNRSGQILQITDAINGTTSYNYGFFGNNVEITDSRGFKTVVLHDELGREVARVVQQDATHGAVTTTEYTVFGEVLRTTQHANRVLMTAISVNAIPSPAASSADRITEYTYDAKGRVSTMTQKVHGGDDIVESYAYDQLDRVTSKTNALGGVTTYVYDTVNRTMTETIAATGSMPAITNKSTYNERGLLAMFEEGTNTGSPRVTTYTYDGLNRLETTTMQAVDVRNSALGSVTTGFVPTETLTYDDVGNVIERTDASGAKTIMWYDDVNRMTAQLVQTDPAGTGSPKGVVTTYTYDDNGNLKTETKHHVNAGVSMSTYATYSETAMDSFVSDEQRTITYEYDALNRLIETRLGSVITGSYNANGGFTAKLAAEPTTSFEYDALGNLVKATDGNGASIFSYFDAAGRKVTEIDGEGYRTDWAYDALGNLEKETRYAEAYDLQVTTLTVGTLPALNSNQSTNALNRVTTFTYDTQGRRLTMTREDVTIYDANATGLATTVDATVTYTYNEMGQVKTKTEATGDVTTYNYDTAGRLKSEVRQSYVDHTGATVAPTVEYEYDSLGNLTTTTQISAAGNRVSTNAYDVAGRLTSVTDTSGFVINYEYDAMGRVTVEHYTRQVSVGTGATTSIEAMGYDYDAMGRVISQGVMIEDSSNAGHWTRTTGTMDVSSTVYNSFGDVASSWVNGEVSGEFIYDAAGRLEATSAGDGLWKFFYYDKAGNETAIFSSSGRDMTQAGTTRDSISALFVGGLRTAQLADVVVTLKEYNARGELVRVEEPQRVIGLDGSGNEVYRRIEVTREYNAFGDMVEQIAHDPSTSANDRTITYTFDNQGKLIKTESAEVDIMLDTGVISQNQRPTEEMFYDASGRLVAMKDANGGVTLRDLLAGTGYEGSEALVTLMTTADASQTSFAYDRFGDVRKMTDAIGRITQMSYDGMGRVTLQEQFADTAAVTAGNAFRRDHFDYDGMGRQIRHTNELAYGKGASTEALRLANAEQVAAVTEYDAQGRVVSQRALGSTDTTTFSYNWDGTISAGLGHSGGWVKTTTLANTKSSSQTMDQFERMVSKTDFGSNTLTYSYDDAGRSIRAESSLSNYADFVYFNTGLTRSVTATIDGSGTQTDSKETKYGYNVFGEQTTEVYREFGVASSQFYDHETGSYFNVDDNYDNQFRDATTTYDNLGRVTNWIDKGADSTLNSAMPEAETDYFYDAKGNVIRLDARYSSIGTNGTAVSENPRTEWYKYDAMDRLLVVAGSLDTTNNEVVSNGTAPVVTYDAVGRRKTVVTVQEKWIDVYATGPAEYNQEPPQPGDPIDPGLGEDPNNPTMVYGLFKAVYDNMVREEYVYDEEDRLIEIKVGETVFTPDATANLFGIVGGTTQDPTESLTTRSEFTFTDWGLISSRKDYDTLGNTVVSSRTVTYDTAGSNLNFSRITEDENVTRRRAQTGSGWDTFTSTSDTYVYGTGAGYMMGQVISHETSTETINFQGTTQGDTSSTVNHYTWYDSAVQTQIVYDPDRTGSQAAQTTDYTYRYWAGAAILEEAAIDDGLNRDVQFVTDLNGQTIRRHEHVTSTTDTPSEYWYRFGGKEMGHITNDGSYKTLNAVAAIDERNREDDSQNPFRFDGVRNRQDFNQGWEMFNSYTQGGGSSTYTAQAGDTLRTAAARLWGDSGLWFKLAQANGMSGDAPLAEGATLYVPSGVQRNTFNASNFKPFNPGETIGDTSPTVPIQPEPPGNNCGIFGEVILTIIAVAITMAISSVIAGPMGMVIGATVGSIVSQGVGVATGIREDFSWNEVALSALSAGVNSAFKPAQDIVYAVGRAMLTNAINQGVAMALGWQSKFSWAGMAGAGVGGAVRFGARKHGGVEDLFGDNAVRTAENFAANVAMNTAAGLANAATRSAIDGTPFGDSLRAALPDIIGSAVGEMLAIQADGGFAERVEGEVTSEGQNRGIVVTGMQLNTDPDAPPVQTPPTEEGAVAEGTEEGELPYRMEGLGLGIREFLAAVDDGLFLNMAVAEPSDDGQLSQDGVRAFHSDGDIQSVSEDVLDQIANSDQEAHQASGRMRRQIRQIAEAVIEARVGGTDQNVEKYIEFSQDERGNLVVENIYLLKQGGRLPPPGEGIVAVAHTHPYGLTIPPHGLDHQPASVGISSFVFGRTADHVWEVYWAGPEQGAMVRNLENGTGVGNWDFFPNGEPFQTNPFNYWGYTALDYYTIDEYRDVAVSRGQTFTEENRKFMLDRYQEREDAARQSERNYRRANRR